MALDLDELRDKLKTALSKETPESLKKWLSDQRTKEAERIKESYHKSRKFMKNLTNFNK